MRIRAAVDRSGRGLPDPEEPVNVRLRRKAGVTMPRPEELCSVLGMGREVEVGTSNPEQLVTPARRHIARQLGVHEGRIHYDVFGPDLFAE
ncbi:hypothetical protein D9M68_799110 [compost metagenome]